MTVYVTKAYYILSIYLLYAEVLDFHVLVILTVIAVMFCCFVTAFSACRNKQQLVMSKKKTKLMLSKHGIRFYVV